MSAEDLAKFPESSRFFGRSPAKDAASSVSDLSQQKRSIHVNNFNSSSNFLPYYSPQVKTKVNYPVDLFHLLPKIALEDALDSPSERDIPVFEYGLHFASDPVLFAETVASIGKKYGAVKFRFSNSNENLFKTYFQINHDVFSFKTNRMLYNPAKNELESRLRFYAELVLLHSQANLDIDPKGPEATVPAENLPAENLPDKTEVKEEIIPELINLESGHQEKSPVTETASPTVKEEQSDLPKDALKMKLPPFLMKLPMMDKRLLDLYDLFRFVVMKGGFEEVVQKKLWAQIGRELGYKGKITSSLSSSLKTSYMKILYPLELHLGKEKEAFVGLDEKSDQKQPDLQHVSELQNETLSSSEKLGPAPTSAEHLSSISHASGSLNVPPENGSVFTEKHADGAKRRKIQKAPLLLGSAKEFRRSIRLKSAKGFLLNEPHLMDIRSPLVLALKNENNGTTEEITPTTATAQVNAFLKWIANCLSVIDDSTRLESNGKLASTYTLRQFVEKDAKFQDFLVANYPEHFGADTQKKIAPDGTKTLSIDQAEALYWDIVSSPNSAQFIDGMKLENGSSLCNIISGSGFPRVGDDFSNFKSHLNNMGFSTPGTSGNGMSVDSKGKTLDSSSRTESLFLNCKPYISRTTGTSLSPFNLHNLPILPDSLLGAYTASDLNNRDMTDTSLQIGMTFSTENWKCEDHFTQLCNYLFLGSAKRWYFIPELEFEKFEALIDEIVEEQEKKPHSMRINKNYRKENWLFDKLMDALRTNDESLNIKYEFLLNSLENMVSPYPEIRCSPQNPQFEKLLNLQKKRRLLYNQEYLITPEMLTERGIEYTTTIQKPGEFIIKYPKTFSSTISFGFNLSEEVNFATRTWLDYAQEGEEWLKKQGLLPNMLVFRLLVNLAQLYESISSTSIHFSGAVYEKALEIYDDLLAKELAIRSQIREICKLKETVIEDRHASEADCISDDDLLNAFPSKVVITELATHQNFVMTPAGFLAYISIFESNREAFPDFLNDPNFSVEFQLFYSDEKLKTFQRLLSGYSVDFMKWMKAYDEMISTGEIIPLKTYKSLLADGQKIALALTTGRETFRKFIHGSREHKDPVELEKLKVFQQILSTLQNFVDESTNIIEECQSILALKHQQRIRNGGTEQTNLLQDSHSNGLERLIQLVDTIPKLIFHVPEFDQIFEFKTEIENFDRACRALIKKEQCTMSEMCDMISLGTSFGIKIPSLEFLIRLRDRQRWLDTYDIIVSGGDPFVGKKEVFSLNEIKAFYEEGLQVLAEADLDKLKAIDQYVYVGNKYEEAVKKYIEENKLLNNVNLNQLEKLLEDMEEKSKMKQDSRLFVTLDIYHELLDLKAQSKLIDFLQNYTSKTHKLFAVKQTLDDLENCGYLFESQAIRSDVEKAEAWLSEVENILDRIGNKPGPKSKKKIPNQYSKHACNINIVKKAFEILNRCETSFAGDDADSLTKSSLYFFLKNLEGGYDEKNPMRYCLCRDYEAGTMIECDKCHEWYHVACVEDKSEIGEDDDKYACPVCTLLEFYRTRPMYPALEGKLLDSVLEHLISKGENLRVVPLAEVSILQAILDLVVRSREYYLEHLASLPFPDMKEVYQMFLLRKFYGSPVMVTGMFSQILDLLKNVNFRLVMVPEALTYPVSFSTKRTGESNGVMSDGTESVSADGGSINGKDSLALTTETSSQDGLSSKPQARVPMTGLGITSHLPAAFQRLAAFQNLALFQQAVFQVAENPLKDDTESK